MIRIEVGPRDLALSRFAISPAFELSSLFKLLGGLARRRGMVPLPWLARLRPAYVRLRREVPIDAVQALLPPGWGADFIAPPPAGIAQTIADDLAAIRATPLAVARAGIAGCLDIAPVTDPAVRTVLASENVCDVLADTLAAGWEALLAPHWPQLRAILERDVVHRAGRLAAEGWAGALDGMHRDVRWRDDRIEIGRRPPVQAGAATGGVLFVPSVFVWPSVATYLDEPWPRALVYPARGIAALWESAAVATPTAALAGVVGTARARLLAALDEPASTTQLVRTLGISLGAAGDHLAALRAAGLVTGERSGRSVLYRRTPVGDAVVAAAAG